jgi:hypothetical protein
MGQIEQSRGKTDVDTGAKSFEVFRRGEAVSRPRHSIPDFSPHPVVIIGSTTALILSTCAQVAIPWDKHFVLFSSSAFATEEQNKSTIVSKKVWSVAWKHCVLIEEIQTMPAHVAEPNFSFCQWHWSLKPWHMT